MINLKKINKNFYYFFSILIIYSIFQFNLFYLAGSNNFFNIIKTNNEIEVTDGILYGNKTEEFSLGIFDRKDKTKRWEDPYLYKEQFKKNDNDYFFKKYISAYGINVKIFGYLNKNYGFNLFALNSINSLIFSIIIIFFYINLKKIFSVYSAALFSIILSTSPWSIVYASELRFIGWTMFLPSLVVLIVHNLKLKNKNFELLIFCFFGFLSILFKCLVTYEYLSTVMMMPLVLFYFLKIKLNGHIIKSYINSSIFGFSLLLGFLVALSIHTYSLNTNKLDIKQNSITDRIKINLGISKNKIEYLCGQNKNIGSPFIYKENSLRTKAEIQSCIQRRNNIDSKSRIEVLGNYFIFRNFLPILGVFENNIDRGNKDDIIFFLKNKNIDNFRTILKNLNYSNYVTIFVLLLQSILFIIFLTFSIFYLIKNFKNKNSIIIIGSFLSSISFFIIAKEWSQIHTHAAYYSWVIGYIPYSSMIIFDHYKKN